MAVIDSTIAVLFQFSLRLCGGVAIVQALNLQTASKQGHRFLFGVWFLNFRFSIHKGLIYSYFMLISLFTASGKQKAGQKKSVPALISVFAVSECELLPVK